MSTDRDQQRVSAGIESGHFPLDVRREREAWLELALEVGKMGIWSWEVATNQLRWSPTLSRVYGLPEGTAPASFEAYLSYVHPDDRPIFERAARRALSEGGDFSSEHRCLTSSGSVAWVRAKAKVFRDAQGRPVSMMGTCIDVTEQKQVENKLLFAERMISVGKLAAGVTHELNTPLGYIHTNVILMRMQLEKRGARDARDVDFAALSASLDAIAEGAERMRDIMGDLGAFSRPEAREPVAVDLRRLLQASANLVANEIRSRATLRFELAESTPLVVANESKLGQVFINLLLNAAHAIDEAGRVDGVIDVRSRLDEQGRAEVSIRDDGAGIEPKVLARIFEPFFTTKEIGKGTGLGLAVCESIVSAHGGHIEVDSESGAGTTFRVVLPATTEPIRVAELSPGAREMSSTREGRILVIDDAPSFRSSLKTLLEMHGFDVVVAESGASALPEALRAPAPDVILCDLMMPGMTGMDFHAALERDRPELARRIVFLTGGAFTPQAAELLDRADNLRLEKPFDLHRLVDAIERVKSLA